MCGAFEESTYDLLNGVKGMPANIAKGVAGGFLLCEKLRGTIAEFSALREDIFDFQFDLMDVLARVIRGNVAKKLFISIQKEDGDFLHADQLLGGFFMTQIFLQSQAWLYCDKLQYRNNGKPVEACNTANGVSPTTSWTTSSHTRTMTPMHQSNAQSTFLQYLNLMETWVTLAYRHLQNIKQQHSDFH